VHPEALLRAAFAAAVGAADPLACVPRYLPEPPKGRTVLVGAGKAAAAMALVVDRHWPAELAGTVVTAQGCRLECPRVEVLEAAHPLPAGSGRRAAERILERVQGLEANDLVICVISGGASALMSLPADGVGLEAKQSITSMLLRSGATIAEINCVRRHLSRIKGGRLAAACHPAKVVTLAISDVPGDDPVDIGSGPTVADPTTCADALAVLERYRIEIPPTVRSGLAQAAWESVKSGDPRLVGSQYRLVATPQISLEAAAAVALQQGITPLILSDRLEGEARVVGAEMAGLARAVRATGRPCRPPCLLLSGGETTVTVRGGGRGGRNVEFLLGFGIALGRCPGVHAIACDTDGVDGLEPIAGALWKPDSLDRAVVHGLSAQAFLDANDAHGFFAALDDSVITGPTRTNVNDFRAVLIEAR
jgi:glycerate-2-kinase